MKRGVPYENTVQSILDAKRAREHLQYPVGRRDRDTSSLVVGGVLLGAAALGGFAGYEVGSHMGDVGWNLVVDTAIGTAIPPVGIVGTALIAGILGRI